MPWSQAGKPQCQIQRHLTVQLPRLIWSLSCCWKDNPMQLRAQQGPKGDSISLSGPCGPPPAKEGWYLLLGGTRG